MKNCKPSEIFPVLAVENQIDEYHVLWQKFHAVQFPEVYNNLDSILQHDRMKKRKRCYWLVIQMYSAVVRYSHLLVQHRIEILPAMLEMLFYFLCRHAFHTTRLVVFEWGEYAAHCVALDGLYLGPTFWMCVQQESALRQLDLRTCPRVSIKNPTVETPDLHLTLDPITERLFLQVVQEYKLPTPYYSINKEQQQ